LGTICEDVRVGTDEERGVVEGSGIKALESRRAFEERSGAGRFGLGVRFGVEEVGSATVEVETGGGG
jgi:hypothetical protein